MVFDMEASQKLAEMENQLNSNRKRAQPSDTTMNEDYAKKQKINQPDTMSNPQVVEAVASTSSACKDNTPPHVHLTPKKRLSIEVEQGEKKKAKFIYGNYRNYYGYRNPDKIQDCRLDIFSMEPELFRGKEVLDIGCHSGMITLAVAQRLGVQRIAGIDIDRALVNKANKCLLRQKQQLPLDNAARQHGTFPYNVSFVHGNYVLRDDVLLELEREQFDVILCLSVTKWIHLNFGDAGLKQAFRRMYKQLRSGGKLILEFQSMRNYARRKHLTDTIYANYQTMQFFPSSIVPYLLSSEIGFESGELMGMPENCTEGFRRPIQIFSKK